MISPLAKGETILFTAARMILWRRYQKPLKVFLVRIIKFPLSYYINRCQTRYNINDQFVRGRISGWGNIGDDPLSSTFLRFAVHCCSSGIGPRLSRKDGEKDPIFTRLRIRSKQPDRILASGWRGRTTSLPSVPSLTFNSLIQSNNQRRKRIRPRPRCGRRGYSFESILERRRI